MIWVGHVKQIQKEKYTVCVYTVLNRTGQMSGSCEYGNEPSDSTTAGDFLTSPTILSYQERLCTMVTVKNG